MTTFSLVGELPRHHYVWVDTEHILKKAAGWVPAVWFGLVSMPGRVWGCSVMLESGAVYRNLPPHAIGFKQGIKSDVKQAQTWDCYGTDFTVIEYRYLQGLRCKAAVHGADLMGRYLFTVAPVGDGFSAYPEQAKEFVFIELDDGRLTIQPTNFVLFEEKSFTHNPKLEWPEGLKRQTETWSVE